MFHVSWCDFCHLDEPVPILWLLMISMGELPPSCRHFESSISVANVYRLSVVIGLFNQ